MYGFMVFSPLILFSILYFILKIDSLNFYRQNLRTAYATRIFLNIRVSLRGYFSISAYIFLHLRVSLRGYFSPPLHGPWKYPRIATRIFLHLRVWNADILKYPRIATRIFLHLRVSQRGYFPFFKLVWWIPPRKRNRWEKSFRVWIRGPGTTDSWKKPELKNLML